MTTNSSHIGKIKAQSTALQIIMVIFTDHELGNSFIISNLYSSLEVDVTFIL